MAKKKSIEPTAVYGSHEPENPIKLTFGLAAPGTAKVAWGFRAIKSKDGFSLLHDRQTWYGERDKELQGFIDKVAIGALSKFTAELDSNDGKYYEFDFGNGVFAVISCVRSYGYVYGVVYK